MKPTVLFAGAGAFGVPTLTRLHADGFPIPLVVSQPDKPAGRGKKLTPTPLAAAAESLGLPVLKTADINRDDLPPADVMVVIAFGQKIAPRVVDHARFGAINLHASLLPRHRGAAPIHWAILSGDEVTGNSVIRLAEKMDAGAVLATSQPREIGTLTTAELHDLLAGDGPALVASVCLALQLGTAIEIPQAHTLATPAKKLSREDTRLNFERPAFEVARRINAMYAWPGCRVVLDDGGAEVATLTLARAEPATERRSPAGTIQPDGTVACGDASIRIIEVQPAGGRLMLVDDYRRGRPWGAGSTVRSKIEA